MHEERERTLRRRNTPPRTTVATFYVFAGHPSEPDELMPLRLLAYANGYFLR
ncbi:hypothetical protein [Pendulispora albinea]|uniref:YaeQ family protein n=1 Tax=Pendulispora albinea TaxID=2741071 RepID=A0ABZ2M3V5_9BACT